MLTRRDVAKMGLAAALLAGLGAVGIALRGTVVRPPRRPLKALTVEEFSVLAAIADRVAPANGDFPAASDADVPEKVDELLSMSHPGVQADFKRVLLLIENAVAGLTTFTGASPDEQDVILEGWRTSGFLTRRIVYKAVVGLVTAAYYASPEVWKAVGYPGPPDYGNVPR